LRVSDIAESSRVIFTLRWAVKLKISVFSEFFSTLLSSLVSFPDAYCRACGADFYCRGHRRTFPLLFITLTVLPILSRSNSLFKSTCPSRTFY